LGARNFCGVANWRRGIRSMSNAATSPVAGID
jgi:hypothetical protein